MLIYTPRNVTKFTVDNIKFLENRIKKYFSEEVNYKTINNETLIGTGNISVQEKLVNGVNIKIINNQSLLGYRNISFSSGSGEAVNFDGNIYADNNNEASLDFISDNRAMPFIRLYGNDANNTGDAVLIGDGGMTILGGGESLDYIYDYLLQNENRTAGFEISVIAADSGIYFYNDYQSENSSCASFTITSTSKYVIIPYILRPTATTIYNV